MALHDDGWCDSAAAWVRHQGDRGDFARVHVLDAVMLPRALNPRPRRALDVGCGEGRFCRLLAQEGVETTGLDPTAPLIAHARQLHPAGTYVEGVAEELPFSDASFDLVVSYLSLIDIPDAGAAIAEMARVLEPGGRLLIANLTAFNTACADRGWVKGTDGRKLHFPVDRYLEERGMWIEWAGIRIVNYHRPMRYYMQHLLGAGLRLTWFDEPEPAADATPSRAENYRRVPWSLVMEWVKPQSAQTTSPE